MNSDDIISYLKFFACSMIISPLLYAFFRLDMSKFESLLCTGVIGTDMLMLMILTYNYLEYGIFWFFVSKK